MCADVTTRKLRWLLAVREGRRGQQLSSVFSLRGYSSVFVVDTALPMMPKIQYLLLILSLLFLLGESLTVSRRRQLLGSLSVLLTPGVASASKYCASGMGDSCDDLAEGNELIMKLQKQSAANKAVNEQAARDAYYMKNYPDFFQTLGKTLVKKPDGTFMAVSDAELFQLKQENKLTVEMPKAMGGRVVDLTQKPILVLKE